MFFGSNHSQSFYNDRFFMQQKNQQRLDNLNMKIDIQNSKNIPLNNN